MKIPSPRSSRAINPSIFTLSRLAFLLPLSSFPFLFFYSLSFPLSLSAFSIFSFLFPINLLTSYKQESASYGTLFLITKAIAEDELATRIHRETADSKASQVIYVLTVSVFFIRRRKTGTSSILCGIIKPREKRRSYRNEHRKAPELFYVQPKSGSASAFQEFISRKTVHTTVLLLIRSTLTDL